MKRISFRQGMLLGFLLIVLLLGGAAVHGWRVVEGLVDESRALNERALAMSAALQELGERSVDIERSARQTLLLDDPVFRQRTRYLNLIFQRQHRCNLLLQDAQHSLIDKIMHQT